jgi:hypothetical protein
LGRPRSSLSANRSPRVREDRDDDGSVVLGLRLEHRPVRPSIGFVCILAGLAAAALALGAAALALAAASTAAAAYAPAVCQIAALPPSPCVPVLNRFPVA